MSAGRPVRELLHAKAPLLGPLVAHSRRIVHIEYLIHRQLEPDLAHHCRVANLRRGVLVIQVDSPAWATRLRYRLPALQAVLAALPELQPLETIRLKVAPQGVPAAPVRPTPAVLPDAAAVALGQTAAGIDDPDLKAALLRLARHRPTRR